MSTPLPKPASGIVAIAGFAQANRHKRQWDAILTCTDPGKRSLRVTDRPQLVLSFEDCDHVELGYKVATRDQIEQAFDFLANQEGSILIHCHHGVGRSAAIALAWFAQQDGPGNEDHSIKRMLAIRPEATPNLVVIAHADDILGREGKLIQALAASEYFDPTKVEMRKARDEFAQENPMLYAKA